MIKIFSSQILIVTVLDLTDSPTNERFHLGDVGPLGADLCVLFENELVLFSRPVSADDLRIEYVVPSFTALSAESAWEVLRYDDPVLSSKLVDLAQQDCVFLRSPLATLILYLKRSSVVLKLVEWVSVRLLLQFFQHVPSLEAPDLGLVGHVLAESVPGVFSVSRHESNQFSVLIT